VSLLFAQKMHRWRKVWTRQPASCSCRCLYSSQCTNRVWVAAQLHTPRRATPILSDRSFPKSRHDAHGGGDSRPRCALNASPYPCQQLQTSRWLGRFLRCRHRWVWIPRIPTAAARRYRSANAAKAPGGGDESGIDICGRRRRRRRRRWRRRGCEARQPRRGVPTHAAADTGHLPGAMRARRAVRRAHRARRAGW